MGFEGKGITTPGTLQTSYLSLETLRSRPSPRPVELNSDALVSTPMASKTTTNKPRDGQGVGAGEYNNNNREAANISTAG